jgi:transposase
MINGALCCRHPAPARCASSLVRVNKNSAAYYFKRFRGIIFLQTEKEANEVFGGEIEVDESYFGGRRKGNRDRGTGVRFRSLAY